MDKKFDYTETIENYIRGEMSGDQKLQFENQLNQDPLLKEELNLQQDLIQSIQDMRRAELKAHLDGVQIGFFDGITSTTGFKVLATTLVTATIGVGSYFAFFTNESTSIETVQEQTTETITETDSEQKPSVAVIPEEDKKKTEKAAKKDTATAVKEEPQFIAKAEKKEESQPTAKEKAEPVKTQAKEEEEVADFNPVIPDLNDNFAEEDSTPDNDIDVPDNELGPAVKETTGNFEIETRTDSRNKFHYRFKSEKLILFGDFSGSTYEIIELNSSIGKSYYLYYDNNFYPLNVENTKITELRVLTDKTLIEELKKIKGNN